MALLSTPPFPFPALYQLIKSAVKSLTHQSTQLTLSSFSQLAPVQEELAEKPGKPIRAGTAASHAINALKVMYRSFFIGYSLCAPGYLAQ
jgi:hypothetical protein